MNRLGWLAVITLLGQILAFIVAPVLTRYYNPGEIGEYKYYMGILGFLTMVGSLGYDRAIYKAREKSEKKYLILISTLFSFLIVIAISVIYITTGTNGFLFVSILLLPNLFTTLIGAYYSSTNNFKKLYLNKIAISIGIPVMKFSVALLGFNIVFLYFSEFLSRMYVCYLAKEKRLAAIGGGIYRVFRNKNKIISVYKKFKIYPTKVYPGIIINAFSLFLPLWFIEREYSYHYVGLYSLCVALTQTPFTVFGNNISIILQSKYREGIEELRKAVFEILSIISCLYVVFPIFMYFNAGLIVDFLFRGNWVELKEYIFPMSIMGAVWGISNPFSAIFHLFDKQDILLRIQIAKFFCRLIVLFIGSIYLVFSSFLNAFIIVSVVLHFIQLFYLIKVISFDVMRFLILNKKSVLSMLAVMVFISVIKSSISDYLFFGVSLTLLIIISYSKVLDLVLTKKNI